MLLGRRMAAAVIGCRGSGGELRASERSEKYSDQSIASENANDSPLTACVFPCVSLCLSLCLSVAVYV